MKNILMWIVCKALGDGPDNIGDLIYKWFEVYNVDGYERKITWKDGTTFRANIVFEESKK